MIFDNIHNQREDISRNKFADGFSWNCGAEYIQDTSHSTSQYKQTAGMHDSKDLEEMIEVLLLHFLFWNVWCLFVHDASGLLCVIIIVGCGCMNIKGLLFYTCVVAQTCVVLNIFY